MELQAFLDRHGVKHFKAGELCSSAPWKLWGNIIPTLFVADALRDQFGPTEVHSGYRPEWYNRAVGGSKQSLHIRFNALDLQPKVGTPQDWKKFLMDNGMARFGGIGTYPTFIHIDTRTLVFRMPAVTWEG